MRKRIDAGLTEDGLAVELAKIIGRGIDGHAGVSGGDGVPGFTPFLIEPVGDRFVAFTPQRDGFVDEAYPFISAMDRRPIGGWLAAAAAFISTGSPQYVRANGVRWLRSIGFLRQQFGDEATATIKVTLASRDGERTKEVTLPVSPRKPIYGAWPRRASHVMDGRIGYLRLSSMSRSAAADVHTWMSEFRDTKGLIVDVRSNGGGSRDALRVLHSYLLSPDAPPRVVNAAVYRLHPAHDEDHLAARFMYRADAADYGDAHRRAIAAFRKTFKPQWTPPKQDFSDWHYLVLGRLDEPGVYHYDKPVVVLMNANCFSATDIYAISV